MTGASRRQRPSVDPHVFAHAQRWMEDYRIPPDAREGDSLEDATWDLAAAIQQAIEDWLDDATQQHRLVEERS